MKFATLGGSGKRDHDVPELWSLKRRYLSHDRRRGEFLGRSVVRRRLYVQSYD